MDSIVGSMIKIEDEQYETIVETPSTEASPATTIITATPSAEKVVKPKTEISTQPTKNISSKSSEILLEIPIIASVAKVIEDKKDGDTDKKLQFSDITDGDVTPISPLKAVLTTSTEHESMMSDDETPRVLTTLETVKKVVEEKPAVLDETEEHEIITSTVDSDDIVEEEIEISEEQNTTIDYQDEEEEEEEAKEVNDDEDEPETNAPIKASSAIALKQLEALNAIKRKKGRPSKTDQPKYADNSLELYKSANLRVEIIKPNSDLKKVEILESKIITSGRPIINKKKDSVSTLPDMVSNGGKSLTIKRISGGKVPNILQSNIISKKELDQEVAERIRKPTTAVLDNSDKKSTNDNLVKTMHSRFSKKIDIIPSKSTLTESVAASSKIGTIEIPHELILGNELEPADVLAADSKTSNIKDQELIAILEDDGCDHLEDIKHHLLSHDDELSGDEDNQLIQEYTISVIDADENDSTNKARIDKELAKEIAMKQIMNLPVKPKGRRPKLKSPEQQHSVPAVMKQTKLEKTSDLVSSLVSDWSDNDSKPDDDKVAIDVKQEDEMKPVSKRKNEPSPTTVIPIKSSRIIKKKIIWDPDAPETQVSYASRINTPVGLKKTTVFVKKQQIPKVIFVEEPKQQQQQNRVQKVKKEKEPVSPVASSSTEEIKILNTSNKRPATVISPSPGKKKKISEIDKLLGDEGAVNMIYSLERENNNLDVPEIVTKPNKNLLISKSKEKKDLVTRAKLIKNVVIKQTTDQAGPSTPAQQRNRPKREASVPQVTTPASAKKLVMTKKKGTASRGSVNSSNASDSWDYVYSRQQCDDSMIIRRRSNSSYSGSTTSPRRLSIDQTQTPPSSSSVTSTSANKKGDTSKGKTFEFAKPNDKKSPKVDLSAENAMVADMKGKLSKALVGKSPQDGMTEVKKEGSKRATRAQATTSPIISMDDGAGANINGNNKTIDAVVVIAKLAKDVSVKLRASERKLGGSEFKELSIRRYDNFVQLILSPTNGKLKNVLNIQILNEIKSALQSLTSDTSCKVVLITSSGSAFCQGIDFSQLIQTTAEKRRHAAQEFATAIRNCLCEIANFPKPLIAGVHGVASGLGVTMLPLFDLVLASDKATFELDSAKLGQIPEGNTVITITNKISHNGITNLIFLCQTLTSTNALDCGLVTKVLWPDKFQEELMQHAKMISSLSSQALEAIKAQMRKEWLSKLDAELMDESKILIQHWISSECQEKFKKYLNPLDW